MARPRVKVVKKDTGWIEFFSRVQSIARSGQVKVGFLDEGPGAETHGDSGLTVAQIAAVLEFGTEDGHIPERSIVRSTFEEKRDEIVKLCGELIGKVLDGKITETQARGLLGAWFAAQIKKKVTAGEHVQPENAPSTIAQKGSDRPWVDTGRVINSVTWALVDKSGK